MGEFKQPAVFHGLTEFGAMAGRSLGTSDWIDVTQDRVDMFAESTDDQQWIHVDAERAASGPFGATIAHGYFTLSLIPSMLRQIYRLEGVRMSVNYGANHVRFPSVVPVGSRLRANARLITLESSDRGSKATIAVEIERDGGDKPVCVAEIIYMYVA